MLVKINNKPVQVTEEPEASTFNPGYFCVSVTGFGLILWLVDYVCYIFFYYHPFPLMAKIAEAIQWIF